MTEDLPDEWPKEAKEDFRECEDCEKIENQAMSLGERQRLGIPSHARVTSWDWCDKHNEKHKEKLRKSANNVVY
jgi:hypothetical protein